MRRVVRIFSSILCLVTMISGIAEGVCVAPGPVCEEYVHTAVLFFGKPTSMVKTDEQTPVLVNGKTVISHMDVETVQFDVIEAYKGIEETTAVIRMSGNCAECYYPFKEGNSYLVFAGIDKETGAFTTSECSPTYLVKSDTDPGLQFLRGLKTAPPTARIFGGVYWPRDGSGGPNWKTGGVADVSVKLQGPNGNQSVQTDANGKYEFAGLTPGEYSLTAEIPRGLIGLYQPVKVMTWERGCAQRDFYTAHDTSISGTVYGPDGAPLNHVHIDVISPEKAAHPDPFSRVNCCVFTDAQGHYRIPNLHPGNYIVGIHIFNPPDIGTPYPRVYLPGEGDLANAKTIKVDYGTSTENADIHIARKLAARDVDVYVSLPDGTPAKSAMVMAEDAELQTVPEVNVNVNTDETGHAVLHLLEGDDFWIDAMVTDSGRQRCGGPARVKIEKDKEAEPVKLVIQHGIGNCFAYLDPRFHGVP